MNLKMIKIGDEIWWESNGVIRTPTALRIRGFSDCGEWVFVDGSDCGIPIKEVFLAKKKKSYSEWLKNKDYKQ